MNSIKFKISPELHDGDNYGILRSPQQVVDAVQAWADNCASDTPIPGDMFSVWVVPMTDEEFDAIPEE